MYYYTLGDMLSSPTCYDILNYMLTVFIIKKAITLVKRPLALSHSLGYSREAVRPQFIQDRHGPTISGGKLLSVGEVEEVEVLEYGDRGLLQLFIGGMAFFNCDSLQK